VNFIYVFHGSTLSEIDRSFAESFNRDTSCQGSSEPVIYSINM